MRMPIVHLYLMKFEKGALGFNPALHSQGFVGRKVCLEQRRRMILGFLVVIDRRARPGTRITEPICLAKGPRRAVETPPVAARSRPRFVNLLFFEFDFFKGLDIPGQPRFQSEHFIFYSKDCVTSFENVIFCFAIGL